MRLFVPVVTSVVATSYGLRNEPFTTLLVLGALGTRELDSPFPTVLPAKGESRAGAAMLIFPEATYAGLAWQHRGAEYAKWLNDHGVTGIVVKYRVGSAGYRHPAMLSDVARSARTVRLNA